MSRFQYDPSLSFFDVTEPIVEHAIASHWLSIVTRAGHHVEVNGVPGTGKTPVVSDFLRSSLRCDVAASRWSSVTMSLSARTQASHVFDVFEQRLHKRRAAVVGAAAGKRVVLFTDDVSLPDKEEYGATPPVELLRSVLGSSAGYWDRKRHIFKHVVDVVAVAACGQTGNGTNEHP
jgi:dynein heavy chain